VIAVGTSVFTVTSADGRYTLRNVPNGQAEIRVLRVGFQEQKKPVAVTAGSTTTLDFALAASVVRLQEVVTTATGEQRKVELGNSVATLDVARRIEEAPIRSFGDLLAAKMPGVQVLPNNMTGGGSRVRIRGTSSLSLSNDPIYVIDGVRMTSGASQAIGVGGTQFNRANDLSPEEIENIEVVKGPSAATLYGTDAANGVIVITTKKGKAGPARWTVFAEHGQIEDRNNYPAQYAILGHLPATPTVARKCVLADIAAGTCIKDSTSVLNIFKDPDLSMIKLGARDNYGAQLSGGTEAVRYFFSADVAKETGPFGLPAFNQRAFEAAGTTIRDEWKRPNALLNTAVRANINAVISPTLDIAVSTGFTKIDQRLPQVDNNVNSFWYNAMTGPGYKVGPGYTGVGSIGQTLNGYASFTPGEMFQYYTSQNVNRFIGSSNINWRPRTWLQTRADIGIDFTDRVEFSLCRFAQCSDFGTNRLGFATDARANIRNFTLNLGATGTWNPLSFVGIKSTAGIQYVNSTSETNRAQGSTLPPGAETPAQGTIPAVGSGTTLQKTLGLFLEEQAAINDRLFITAAVRTDQNSAFGTNFQRVYYPKGSISWIVSDESFFPKIDFVNQLRFRMSAGSSGVQPGPNDAARTFGTTTTAVAGVDVGGLRSANLGNPNIKPERTTEFETGFETKLFSNRISVEATYYNKKTQDALFSLTIAPSAGSSNTTLLRNLGGVQNTGVEFSVNTQIIDKKNLGWDLTFNASHNGNKLNSLGKLENGNAVPTVNPAGTVQQRNGYPLNGYWGRPFTWGDANKDGLIAASEVAVKDTFVFIGYSQPRDEISITNGVDLLARKLRLVVAVDNKGGSNLLNNQEAFLCTQTTSCPYTSSPTASTWNQARTVAARNFGTLNTQLGFYEPLQFWRLREISATYTIDEAFAAKFLRARGGSVNLGVRNVKLWTSYSGLDPEANYGEGNTQNTLLTAGPPTYYTLRINVRY
jgi:TonB-linked SusC/RagA family outer membrane protein